MINLFKRLIVYLENIHSVWNNEPTKITALATSINATVALISLFVGIATLFINWKNSKKDATNLDVVARRAQDGPLILQHPDEEFILFEVYNKSLTSVVINEIGFQKKFQFKLPFKSECRFVNLVNLADSGAPINTDLKPIGRIEGVLLPGTIKPKSFGTFWISYSKMKKSALNYQSNNLSIESLDFGRKRVIKSYQEMQKHLDTQGKNLQIVPYVLTGCGKKIIGKKYYVQLGNLGNTFSFK